MVTKKNVQKVLNSGLHEKVKAIDLKALEVLTLLEIRDELKRFNDAAYPEGLDTKRDREDLAARFSEKEIRDNLEAAKSKLNPVGDERIL